MTAEYEVRRTRTFKRRIKGAEWETWDRDRKRFPTIEAVRAYLAAEYGRCTRHAIYRDTEAGANRVGTIYSYHEGPASHGDQHKWCQDWVEVYAMTSERVAPRQWSPRRSRVRDAGPEVQL